MQPHSASTGQRCNQIVQLDLTSTVLDRPPLADIHRFLSIGRLYVQRILFVGMLMLDTLWAVVLESITGLPDSATLHA